MGDGFESPDEFRMRLAARWPTIAKRSLLGEITFPHSMRIKGKALTRRVVSGDLAGASNWVRSWTGLEVSGGEVVFAPRSPGGMGRPLEVRFDTSDSMAAFVGVKACEAHRGVVNLSRQMEAIAVGGSSVARAYGELVKLGEEDRRRLASFVSWRRENPGSELALREAPIPGLDTKWVERHQSIVMSALEAVGLRGDGRRIAEAAGFRSDDKRCLWAKMHPGDGRPPLGGPQFAIRPSEARHPHPAIRQVLVVENETPFLSFDPAPGVLLLLGSGHAAASMLGDLPWLGGVELLYWGDCDGHGYAMVDAIRAAWPHARTLMMDERCVAENWTFVVEEPESKGWRGDLERLTPTEQAARQKLRSAGRRLEQERIGRQAEALISARLVEAGRRAAA